MTTDKPHYVLAKITDPSDMDTMAKIFEELTGRKPSAEEIEEARADLAKARATA